MTPKNHRIQTYWMNVATSERYFDSVEIWHMAYRLWQHQEYYTNTVHLDYGEAATAATGNEMASNSAITLRFTSS